MLLHFYGDDKKKNARIAMEIRGICLLRDKPIYINQLTSESTIVSLTQQFSSWTHNFYPTTSLISGYESW